MVSIDKIERGIAAWLDSELLEKMASGTYGKVIAGTAGGIIVKRVGTVIRSYSTNKAAVALGLIDPDGAVDLEIIKDEMIRSMPDQGIQFSPPLIGTLTFYPKDIQSLYEFIMRA